MSVDLPVTLTVRGTLIPTSLEAARVLHNNTAGSAPGIAAARALGDLSHKVFAPTGPNGKPGELLFLDVWCEAAGIMQFFSNPEVQHQGGAMFSAKDASVWMPARGAYSYHLPAARGAEAKYVGIVRGTVASAEKSIETFVAADHKGVRDARLRGLLSHELFVRLGAPNEPVELLGIDRWMNLDGMVAHYSDKTHMAPLANAFSAPPAASMWEQATGAWSEW